MSSDVARELFPDTPELPYLCRLPSRTFLEQNTAFSWVKPPECWPAREQSLFRKIRHSSTYRRLLLASSMVNNVYTWSAVRPTDFQKFYDEARALLTFLPQSVPLRCRLTGGFEDFFTDVLHADLTIGTSALTTPPEMTYVGMSPHCIPFGASPVPLDDLIAPNTCSYNVLLRPDGVPKSKLIHVLDVLDRKLRFPLSRNSAPFMVFVLYCRSHCRVFNQWVSGYETANRVHVCAQWQSLQMKSMEHTMRPKWLTLHGPWELILIQQGTGPLGESIDIPKYRAALQRLCKTHGSMHASERSSSCRASSWSRLPHDQGETQTQASRLKKFWSEWDEMAEKRRQLLSKKRLTRANWLSLDANYLSTNAMLINCPVPRLSRAARLAKIDVSRSLLTPSCSAYAILGKFPTYVGQVGARAKRRRRPFMDRLKGHFARAKTLKTMYMGRTPRRRKRTQFLRSTPSLPKLLALHGTHQVTMRPMEDAAPNKLDAVEYKLERILSPCCNAVEPYAGPQRVDWLLAGSFNLETVGNLKQLAAEICTCNRLQDKYTVPQLLTVLLECKRPLHPNAFRTLFAKVQGHLLHRYNIFIPERIPVRVPIPDKMVLLALRSQFSRMLNLCRLPSPLTAWLNCVLPIHPPTKNTKSASTAKGVTTGPGGETNGRPLEGKTWDTGLLVWPARRAANEIFP